jgi:hypothetical protein
MIKITTLERLNAGQRCSRCPQILLRIKFYGTAVHK